MKNRKVVTILILLGIVLLAGVTVFLGNKLLSTRNQSVSPAAPESNPAANAVSTSFKCGTSEAQVVIKAVSTDLVSCPHTTIKYCQENNITNPITEYSVSVTLSVDRDQSEPAAIGAVARRLRVVKATNFCPNDGCGQTTGKYFGCWDNGTSNTEYVDLTTGPKTITLTRSSGPTGEACGSYQLDIMLPDCQGTSAGGNCQTGINCTGQTPPPPTTPPTNPPNPTATPSVGGHCAPVEWSLDQPTDEPTPTVTATPTSTPRSCDLDCSTNADCDAGLICSGGMCRNPECLGETDCSCPAPTPTLTATPTPGPTNPPVTVVSTPTNPPTEPNLPNAGVGTPAILSLGGGALLVVTAILLAL